jgi:hypothetical protein
VARAALIHLLPVSDNDLLGANRAHVERYRNLRGRREQPVPRGGEPVRVAARLSAGRRITPAAR